MAEGWLRVRVLERRGACVLVEGDCANGAFVSAWVRPQDVGMAEGLECVTRARDEAVAARAELRAEVERLIRERDVARENASDILAELRKAERQRDAREAAAGDGAGPRLLAEGVWGPTPPGAAVVFDPGWDPQDGQRRAVAVAADGFARIDIDPVGEGPDGRRATRVEVPWSALRAMLAARDEDLAAGGRR